VREEHEAYVAGIGPGDLPVVGGVGANQRVVAAAAVDGHGGDVRVVVNDRRRQAGDIRAGQGDVPASGVAAVVDDQLDIPGAGNVHEALDRRERAAGGRGRLAADDHGVLSATVVQVHGAGSRGDEHPVVAAAGVQVSGVVDVGRVGDQV